MKTTVIIQARMGSTRLPGKVMRDLCGNTVLGHVITRVKACTLIDEIVVATTESPVDFSIVEESKNNGVLFFQGSEEDVLARFYFASKTFNTNVVVRITADCPLIDPHIMGEMLKEYNNLRLTGEKVDYLSNTMNRTYPRGLDVEIFSYEALQKAYNEALHPDEREHVTPYIKRHPELFNLRNFLNNKNLSDYRWTLDTKEDWEFILKVYTYLYDGKSIFTTNDVLQLLQKHPDFLEINKNIRQNS